MKAQKKKTKIFNFFQLFHILTKQPEQGFEDNFADYPISAWFLQRKLAPQTVALTAEELAVLVEADHLELFHQVFSCCRVH